MFSVGIIGTSSIAHEFAKALQLSNKFQVRAIYSRTLFTAESFGKVYGADYYYDHLDDMMASSEIELVYIASPNSLHFSQTLLALQHGKHVIVEKPAFSTLAEWKQAHQLADEKGLFLFEAARHFHSPNFHLIKNEVAKFEGVDGAIFHFGKYSSRYNLVLQGEEPNIFSPHFSGGALMDLGVYLLYAAIGWFGEPESGKYYPKKIQTGVDGAGTIMLQYPYFDAVLHVSKISNLFAKSEIHCGEKTLLIDDISMLTSVELHDAEINKTLQLAVPGAEHFMLDEALAFAQTLENPADKTAYQAWTALSKAVHKWSEQLRKEAGIYFDADTNNEE